jgi:hypothetical protein
MERVYFILPYDISDTARETGVVAVVTIDGNKVHVPLDDSIASEHASNLHHGADDIVHTPRGLFPAQIGRRCRQ